MSESGITLGIVGFGFAGQLHAEVASAHPLVDRVFVTDNNQKTLKLANSLGKTEPLASIDQLLLNKPDVIITALPSALNRQTVQRIVDSNHHPKALMIEKPVATTYLDALAIQEIISATSITGVTALTGYYHPEFERARQLIQMGAIGEVRSIIEKIRLGGPNFPESYLQKIHGGIVNLTGIHGVSHNLFLTGHENWKVESSNLGFGAFQADSPDSAEVEFSSGLIRASHKWIFTKQPTGSRPEDYCVEVNGTNGRSLKIYGFRGVVLGNDEIRVNFHRDGDDLRERHKPGFRQELDALIATTNGDRSPTPLSTGVKLQKILHQVEQAARSRI